MKNQNADEKVVDINEDTSTEVMGVEEIYHSSVGYIQSLQDKGASAEDITYTLAYTATQFGLWYTDNSYRVFPVVLKGVDDASRKKMVQEDAQNAENTTQEDSNEQGVTIH